MVCWYFYLCFLGQGWQDCSISLRENFNLCDRGRPCSWNLSADEDTAGHRKPSDRSDRRSVIDTPWYTHWEKWGWWRFFETNPWLFMVENAWNALKCHEHVLDIALRRFSVILFVYHTGKNIGFTLWSFRNQTWQWEIPVQTAGS